MSEVGKQPQLEYLVPRRINQGFEFALGWGVRQVAAALIGLVVGGFIFLVMHLLKVYVLLQVFPIIFFSGLGFILARPQLDGSTALDLIAALRAWKRKQKLYLYDWGREDW